MRKILVAGCAFIFIVAGCSPSVPIIAPTPTVPPTLVPTAIVENPPPCPEAELIYHLQLQQMLLVNCVEDASKENPNILWGWDGKQ